MKVVLERTFGAWLDLSRDDEILALLDLGPGGPGAAGLRVRGRYSEDSPAGERARTRGVVKAVAGAR